MNVSTLFQLAPFSVIKDPANVNRINSDFYIYNDIMRMPLYEVPSRLDNTVISLCLNGYTRVAVNMQEYFIGPGTMMIAMPDQILQSIEVSDEYQGVFIVASRSYTDEIFPKLKITLPFFFYTKEYPCINIKGDELNCIIGYYDMFWGKTKLGKNSPKEVIQILLMALFFEIYNIYRQRIPRKIERKNRKEVLYDQFMRTLSENYKKERAVNFYARKLFLTPKHLSSVVKEVSGKTAGEWIDNFVLYEAKALLKSSPKNIQEISDELNFANQSFFGKYFKHHTGVSPKEYRKK